MCRRGHYGSETEEPKNVLWEAIKEALEYAQREDNEKPKGEKGLKVQDSWHNVVAP